MNIPMLLGLGGAAAIGALIRKSESDARVALALGCGCRERKIVALGSGRHGLG